VIPVVAKAFTGGGSTPTAGTPAATSVQFRRKTNRTHSKPRHHHPFLALISASGRSASSKGGKRQNEEVLGG
jgi:hypothetical protein